MPLGVKPVCSVCKTSNSTMWRKGNNGDVLCNMCSLKQTSNGKESNGQNGASERKTNGNKDGPVLRKSARIKPSKHRFMSSTKAVATKGKSRRILFKKSQPIKAPTAISTVVTGESVFHDGMYYQTGDIVSLVDHDGSVYYAQIRGFMQDQFNEKSAVISWLLPTQSSPRDKFDPSTYILGPEEDLPRKMDYMEFVCHAPSDYYKTRRGPYPTISCEPELCYVWTSIGEQIARIPTTDEIFGMTDCAPKTVIPTKSGKEDKSREKHKKHEKSEKEKDKQTDKEREITEDKIKKEIPMDVS